MCYVGRGGVLRTSRMTRGVPQGSVLGPALWNIGYDAVLRVDLPPGGDVVGYADDTLILVEGSSLPEVLNRANVCVAIVVDEIGRLGLRVSPLKTGIVLVRCAAGCSRRGEGGRGLGPGGAVHPVSRP